MGGVGDKKACNGHVGKSEVSGQGNTVIHIGLCSGITPGNVFEPNLVLGSGKGKLLNPWTIPFFWGFFLIS